MTIQTPQTIWPSVKVRAFWGLEDFLNLKPGTSKLRHFLFTWLKKQGVEDALIQPASPIDNPE
jgi:hypothetical protein